VKPFKDYLKEEIDSQYITEGLISSYSSGKLADEIKKLLGKNIEEIKYTELPEQLIQTKYGDVFTVHVVLNNPLSPIQDSKLNKLLNLYGYTNSLKHFNSYQLQLEPKYPVKINKLIEESIDRQLYHITKNQLIPKIKKIGVVPKISQTTFDHPGDRIYLLWLPYNTPEDKGRFLAAMRQVLARNKNIDKKDMSIIATEYDPSVDYYIDDTTANLSRGIIGIFTTTNIPPAKLGFL
jgi:hypothetical protein